MPAFAEQARELFPIHAKLVENDFMPQHTTITNTKQTKKVAAVATTIAAAAATAVTAVVALLVCSDGENNMKMVVQIRLSLHICSCRCSVWPNSNFCSCLSSKGHIKQAILVISVCKLSQNTEQTQRYNKQQIADTATVVYLSSWWSGKNLFGRFSDVN